MAKFAGLITGAAMVIAGGVLALTGVGLPAAVWLIVNGGNAIIAGGIAAAGALLLELGRGPIGGFATTVRNPTSPWKVIYGRTRVGGTMVHMHTWGDNNKMLDLVIVLAAHSCAAVEAVLFDQQRLVFDTSARPGGAHASAGTSVTPVQQAINIASIARSNGVVTVQLNAPLPQVMEGDPVKISGVTTDATLNGSVPIAQILAQDAGSIRFTYLSGGGNVSIGAQGKVETLWAEYGRKVYFEPLLGDQVLGATFAGMAGTPYDGDRGNVVNPDHVDGLGGGSGNEPNPWTSHHSLVGKTAVFLRLHYNEKYFANGLPQISFLVRGKNDIYDPREAAYGYTENAALCVADFLAHPTWGFKAEYGTDIPTAELIAAANVCDEAVPLAISTLSLPVSEPAYACNGQFDLTSRRGEVLRSLLTSCGGRLLQLGGQYFIQPAAWYGNSFAIGSAPGMGVIALPKFEEIAAGPIEWRPTVSVRDLYNGAKGTYISPANRWQSSDIPAYAQDTRHGYSTADPEDDANMAADGGERRWLDVQLPFTISPSGAQRLLKIELLRRRQFGAGSLTFNTAAYPIVSLDNLLISIAYLNWSAKQLEVANSRFRSVEGETGPTLVVDLDVQETDPAIYAWSTAEELSPQGYVQPAIPGVGSLDFFSKGETPGFQVPFPWAPGFLLPFAGDALYPGPVLSDENKGRGTFGMRVRYGSTEEGLATANMDILGVTPPTRLSAINPPQISCVAGNAGNLAAGTYVLAATALDTETPASYSRLSVPIEVTIPDVDDGHGSIAVTVHWPPESNGGEVFMADDDEVRGYHLQAELATGESSLVIEDFDRSTRGAPDTTCDHIAIAWQKVVHSGSYAAQVQVATENTVTLGGAGMGANYWAGCVLSLLGKLDSSESLVELNMPVLSSSATDGDAEELQDAVSGDSSFVGGLGNADQWAFYWNLHHTPLTGEEFSAAFTDRSALITAEQFVSALGGVGVITFTLTIGPNANGDQLPDLTTLLVTGDLVVIRFKTAFTDTTFSDTRIANPVYPTGADPNMEPGRKAMVLTGPNAGDVQTIAAVGLDGDGKYTIFHLAAPWTVMPNDGDIVIVLEADWGPDSHGQPIQAAAAVTGVVASPAVTNLAGQTWLFLARTHTANHRNGADRWAPAREMYVFGSQGTRTITESQAMRSTDQVLDVDASAGAVVIALLPFYQIPNRTLFVQKIDASANPVTIQCEPGDTINGQGAVILLDEWKNCWVKVSGNG